MRLDLAVDEEVHRWRPAPEWQERARTMLRGVGPDDAGVEFVVTGDEELHRLNREYRGKDRPTDVLSFSYLEGHETHRSELVRGARAAAEFCDDPTPEGESLLAGQILVSVDTVLARGPRAGRDLDDEILFLLAHGVLHVLGYDHESDTDAAEMEAEERRVMGLVAQHEGGEAS